MEELYQEHKEQVRFYFVYVREAHKDRILPGENQVMDDPGFINADGTWVCYAKRAELAKKCWQLSMPALTDSPDGAAATAFDAGPTRIVIIDRNGMLATSAGIVRIDHRATLSLDGIGKWLQANRTNPPS